MESAQRYTHRERAQGEEKSASFCAYLPANQRERVVDSSRLGFRASPTGFGEIDDILLEDFLVDTVTQLSRQLEQCRAFTVGFSRLCELSGGCGLVFC